MYSTLLFGNFEQKSGKKKGYFWEHIWIPLLFPVVKELGVQERKGGERRSITLKKICDAVILRSAQLLGLHVWQLIDNKLGLTLKNTDAYTEHRRHATSSPSGEQGFKNSIFPKIEAMQLCDFLRREKEKTEQGQQKDALYNGKRETKRRTAESAIHSTKS